MFRWAFARRIGSVGALLAALSAGAESWATTVITRVSQPSRRFPHHFYDAKFQFPEGIREFSDATLVGYSFRQPLRDGGVRELEISRLHSRGAYLMVTDLFSNGRFSTMSHSVLMVFPRDGTARKDPYLVSEDGSGDMRIVAPDGSILLVDVASGAVKATRDFYLAPQGAPGRPPVLRHRGFHVELTAVGKNPFLRGTPATVTDAYGETCKLSSEDLFRYGRKIESDVFRFDTDAEFFSYLAVRCPSLDFPPMAAVAHAPVAPSVVSMSPGGAVPILLPEDVEALPRPPETKRATQPAAQKGGALRLLRRIFGN
jgi:hypothetical protein